MEQQSKEQFVHTVFESIAPKYDFMNDLISFRRHKAWRAFAMKKMTVNEGDVMLDLCCGTCDWTIRLAEVCPTGKITGLDFSRNMLEIGRQKLAAKQLDKRVELVEGNAMALPFQDRVFDTVTMGFALRNVPDLRQVLAEVYRVLKPGGSFVCLELSKPTWQPFKALYYFYFRRILPLLGKVVAKRYEQYKWLPESLLQFPDRHQLADIFRETGYGDVRVYPFFGGIAALHIGQKGNEA